MQIGQQKSAEAHRLLESQQKANSIDEQESAENLNLLENQDKALRKEAKGLVEKVDAAADSNDTNYIFLNFVLAFLPAGLIGLLIAVVFSASWNSTASELNALASTSIVDMYKRLINKHAPEQHYVKASKVATLLWGGMIILVAMFANRMGSLIEAVNILGSLFYGTILGVFLVAFFLKKVGGVAVFYAAVITEALVITCFIGDVMAFLWLNMFGCLTLMLLAWLIQQVIDMKNSGKHVGTNVG